MGEESLRYVFQFPSVYSGCLQNIEEDPSAGSDEHHVRIDLKVLVYAPQYGLVHQHSGQYPDDQH